MSARHQCIVLRGARCPVVIGSVTARALECASTLLTIAATSICDLLFPYSSRCVFYYVDYRELVASPESSTLLCFVAISEVYLGINVVLSTTLVTYLAYEGGSRRPLSRVCVATRASVSVIAVVPLSLVSCRVVSREPMLLPG